MSRHLAFLASWREQIPVLDSHGPPENLREPRKLSNPSYFVSSATSFVGRKSFVSVLLSADSFEESFALKFVQQAHIQKAGHLFLVFSERENEIAPAIGFGSRNVCHFFRIEAIGLLQGCTKNPDRRLLKKISEAYEGNGVLEYGNIGILGFKRIHPSFHPSTIPIFITLERGV